MKKFLIRIFIFSLIYFFIWWLLNRKIISNNNINQLIKLSELINQDYKNGFLNEDKHDYKKGDFDLIYNCESCISKDLLLEIDKKNIILNYGFSLENKSCSFLLKEEKFMVYSSRYYTFQNYKPEPNNEGDMTCQYRTIEYIDDGWYYVIEECTFD